MIEIYGIIIFLLGTIIGSFLGVVIWRLNTGRGFGGRSMCLTCRRQLSWHELVPIVSFLNQRGKCYVCRTKIPRQDFFIEVITGIVFVSIFMKMISLGMPSVYANIWYMVFYMYIFSLLIVISVYDFKHFIIPDKLVWIFNFLALVSTFFVFDNTFMIAVPSIATLLAGPVIALPFWILWKITGGKGMGLGDAKLALGMGWLLGMSLGLTAFMLSFWIGTLFALILLALKRGIHRKTKIPFGPFMCIALFIVFIFNVTIQYILGTI